MPDLNKAAEIMRSMAAALAIESDAHQAANVAAHIIGQTQNRKYEEAMKSLQRMIDTAEEGLFSRDEVKRTTSRDAWLVLATAQMLIRHATSEGQVQP